MLDEDPLVSIEKWVDLHSDCILYYQRQEVLRCTAPGCRNPATQGPVGGTVHSTNTSMIHQTATVLYMVFVSYKRIMGNNTLSTALF